MALSHLDQAASYANRKNRRRRQTVSDWIVAGFAGVDGTPHDFGAIAAGASSAAALALPANSRFAVSLSVAWDVGDIAIEDNAGNTIVARAGEAGAAVQVSSLFVRGREIQIARGAAAPAGDFSLYLIERDRLHLVATATFT